MFGIRAGKAFEGERVVPGGALVLVDDGRIAGVEPGTAPAWAAAANAARDRRFWSAVAMCLAGSDRLLRTP